MLFYFFMQELIFLSDFFRIRQKQVNHSLTFCKLSNTINTIVILRFNAREDVRK